MSAGEEQKEEEKEEVEEEEEEKELEEEEEDEDEAEEEEEEEEIEESGIFIQRYQQLSQEDTDVPEVNDDNYIYLDEMLTEYEFTEYEPDSVSSSDGSYYSDSAESEQMINAQVGTVDTDVRSSVGVHSATAAAAAAAARTCVVCLTRPVNATITHGVSAHFVCCMRCGRRLARKRKGCPICRKTIESVILTYT